MYYKFLKFVCLIMQNRKYPIKYAQFCIYIFGNKSEHMINPCGKLFFHLVYTRWKKNIRWINVRIGPNVNVICFHLTFHHKKKIIIIKNKRFSLYFSGVHGATEDDMLVTLLEYDKK